MHELEFDPEAMSCEDAKHLLNALVVPRPIAWISTVDGVGVYNVAPHSYFNLVSIEPAILQFVSTGKKDTLKNVLETGSFVVNIVPFEMADSMVETAQPLPSEIDEFE